ncbi:cytochrome c oxidase subunit II [Microaerobacter geothermalis]|uniref:cytochrome c oxidase subunit II n=1 Tax=Microaerobacter geothermalis TaxID=674972 RepID=UPI001F238F6D|nr:cytochrome c oxidase subunit II [Microaerobacter geothermalis]MCF6094381.1 cytochrome c oxidase subunit II [Microaerobacter geothermalis]
MSTLFGYQWFMIGLAFLMAIIFIVWLLVAAYRRTNSNIPHSTEWWFVFLVLLAVVMAFAWSLNSQAAYEKSIEKEESFDKIIRVYEYQWGFAFINEKTGESSRNSIEVKPGEKILFKLSSNDVIHGFNIPSVGMIKEIEPGAIMPVSIEAPEKPGEYIIQCTEYCGIGHYQMKAKLIVGGEA